MRSRPSAAANCIDDFPFCREEKALGTFPVSREKTVARHVGQMAQELERATDFRRFP
jgi:hypothetical protein